MMMKMMSIVLLTDVCLQDDDVDDDGEHVVRQLICIDSQFNAAFMT